MHQNICPNYTSCQIITKPELLKDSDQKQYYISTFCKERNGAWLKCRRYQTKAQLNFCPDFVLPDSNLSIDEILDKFDEQSTD
jgi:hypothetical protein